MRERPGAPAPSPDAWAVGDTRIAWEDDALVLRFDEPSTPVGGRLRGTVRLTPELGLDGPLTLDRAGRHRWWPVAPRSRAVVELEQPALRFEGHGYHDANWGSEALEAGFRRWTWSRAWLPDGVALLYDTEPRDGPPGRLGLLVDGAGVRAIDPPARVTLPDTGWGVFRETRADAPGAARVQRTLEDTPFYNRSLVQSTLLGHPVLAVHEALDLDRFASGWVQLLLPFKSRRLPA